MQIMCLGSLAPKDYCCKSTEYCSTHLARLTLAFWPPLSVIPLSPTRVRSLSGNSSKSCTVYTTFFIMDFYSSNHLPFPKHMPLLQCRTIQDYRIVQIECFLLEWLSTTMTPDWQMPHCLSPSHYHSEQEALSIYTGANWTVEKFMQW